MPLPGRKKSTKSASQHKTTHKSTGKTVVVNPGPEVGLDSGVGQSVNDEDSADTILVNDKEQQLMMREEEEESASGEDEEDSEAPSVASEDEGEDEQSEDSEPLPVVPQKRKQGKRPGKPKSKSLSWYCLHC
jgi:hypothetical protein